MWYNQLAVHGMRMSKVEDDDDDDDDDDGDDDDDE